MSTTSDKNASISLPALGDIAKKYSAVGDLDESVNKTIHELGLRPPSMTFRVPFPMIWTQRGHRLIGGELRRVKRVMHQRHVLRKAFP